MSLACSVILCTHNPRRDYVARTLEALRAQTHPMAEWELLVIDNASNPNLDSFLDLSWHPHGRIVREEKLGLTAARLCGIKATRSEMLIFVDDDNVLKADYIAQAIRIGREFPFLGVWGGQILPEYEVPPPRWAEPYLASLALFSCPRDVWSNVGDGLCRPCGAGMCLRAGVARKYSDAITQAGGLRAALGRRGGELTSGEDNDLALVAVDAGLATGRFRALEMRHLIPRERLTEDYFLRLTRGNAYSYAILNSIRSPVRNEFVKPGRNGHAIHHLFQFLTRVPLPSRSRRFRLAAKEGLRMARQRLAESSDHHE